MSNSVALLIARILLSLLFLMGGLEKFSAIEGTAGYIAAYGFPASTLLAWLAAIFETVAGIAILLIEQYLDFARELADTVAILDRGEVVFSGIAKDLDDHAVRRHLVV